MGKYLKELLNPNRHFAVCNKNEKEDVRDVFKIDGYILEKETVYLKYETMRGGKTPVGDEISM